MWRLRPNTEFLFLTLFLYHATRPPSPPTRGPVHDGELGRAVMIGPSMVKRRPNGRCAIRNTQALKVALVINVLRVIKSILRGETQRHHRHLKPVALRRTSPRTLYHAIAQRAKAGSIFSVSNATKPTKCEALRKCSNQLPPPALCGMIIKKLGVNHEPRSSYHRRHQRHRGRHF